MFQDNTTKHKLDLFTDLAFHSVIRLFHVTISSCVGHSDNSNAYNDNLKGALTLCTTKIIMIFW